MGSSEDQKGASAPGNGDSPVNVSHSQTTDDSFGRYEDPYAYPDSSPAAETAVVPAAPPPPPPPPPPKDEESEPDEDGMLRMSFLEHLEELRTRLIRMLMGVGVAFVLSLTYSERLWSIIQAPAEAALKSIGARPVLIATDPMEQFQIIWMKLPILSAVFLSSPWILYQIWSFIAPGLYKKERRWAAPPTGQCPTPRRRRTPRR